jgi:phytoene dehydrogenase-like protein
MTYDAVVVGSGPNGLSAAIALAQFGLSVLVIEANETIGGAARTLELTLPSFLHDIGSAVHPMALASPFFRSLRLEEHGLEWIQPPVPLAHPLDGEPAVLMMRDIAATATNLAPDERAYQSVIGPFVRFFPELTSEILSPPIHLPKHPFMMARFGTPALFPADLLGKTAFRGNRARALFAGLACHSIISLDMLASSAIGLVMAMAGHAVGWPIPRGGSQQITNALASCLRSLGGVIETSRPITSVEELPSSKAVLFDLSPHQFAKIAAGKLSRGYAKKLSSFRHGPGVFKVDWALSGPIPWIDPECAKTATLHLGGSAPEISAGERAVWKGKHFDRPFVLLAQQSLFDPSRAPAGKHTGWAYCHVPNGSTVDMTEVIEAQVERFAPGFRDLILARSARNTAEMQLVNANLIGGDIGGGANNLIQLIFRPTPSLDPYRMRPDGLYLCSSSTPPGGGVHGMCGYHAAQSALKHTFRIGTRSFLSLAVSAAPRYEGCSTTKGAASLAPEQTRYLRSATGAHPETQHADFQS